MGALYSVKDGFTEFNRTAAEIAWDNEVAVNKSKGPNPPPRRSKKEEDFGLSARNVAAILVTACGLLGTGVQFILNILISIGLSKVMVMIFCSFQPELCNKRIRYSKWAGILSYGVGSSYMADFGWSS